MESNRRMSKRPTSNVVIRRKKEQTFSDIVIERKVQSHPVSRSGSISRMLLQGALPPTTNIDLQIKESNNTVGEILSNHTETACTSSTFSACSTNKLGSCQLGPRPLTVLQKPSAIGDWEPYATPRAASKQKWVRISRFADASERQLPADHEATVIAPLNQRSKWERKPRESCESSTPSTLHRMLLSNLSSPVQVKHSKCLQIHSLSGGKNFQVSSLRNISAELLPHDQGSKAPIGQSVKKVQFAANSILHIYRKTEDVFQQ